MKHLLKSISFIPLIVVLVVFNSAFTKTVSLKSAAMSDTTKKFDMIMTRTFDASPEMVWKAWSDSNWIKQWWGPTGFTSPNCRLQFWEGGTTIVCMRAPAEWGGMDMYNSWTYKKINPLKSIEYTFDWVDKDGNLISPASMGLPPNMPRNMRHLVTIKDLGNGKTEMTIAEYGYPTEELVKLSHGGMGQCLDKMAAIFVSK